MDMDSPILKVHRIEDSVVLPEYKSDGASGMDICFFPYTADCIDGFDKDKEPYCLLRPNQVKLLRTGLSFEIPEGYELQVRARSGLSSRGVLLANGIGTIDSDYRGEVLVPLLNVNEMPFKIKDGDRIAQIVIVPVTQCTLFEVEELSYTVRGKGGFGSTGR